MADYREEWQRTKEELIETLTRLDFPEELGDAIAKNLGSPKAMKRMISYLINVKPRKVEMVVDEMLAIASEIEVWKDKKASEAANASYNEMLYHGLNQEEE